MKLRPLIAALFTFWLVVGPVGTTWAAYAATPCESMGSMSQTLPQGACCPEGMDLAACLSACLAISPSAAAPAQLSQPLRASETVVPSLPIRHAAVLAPPDIAPPKSFVS